MTWTYKPKPKGGKGKLIYNCVICEKKILKPELGQFTCRDKKCNGKYWRFRRTLKLKSKMIKIEKDGKQGLSSI
jgi:hypothetical protein